MKIAMLGQKGMPAHSGGVEQHVDILSRHLVERGHEVVVYCRRSYCGRAARSERQGGLHRVVRPSIPTKHLDAITHTVASTIDVALRRADVVHYHCIGPAAVAPLARLAGLPVVVTVHSLDWQRAKWGRVAQRCLRAGERLATLSATRLVVVSPVLRDYFAERFGVAAEYIPNAVAPFARPAAERIGDFGLQAKRYVLAVSRLEPGKGLEELIEAFERTSLDAQLVIAGGPGFDRGFEEHLRRTTDPRVVFTGAADRELMAELYAHAALFALPSPREGMSIALLEAMSMGLPVLVSDIPENRCVVEDAGFTFKTGDVADLRQALETLLCDADGLAPWGAKAARQAAPYQWPRVVDQLENVYAQCVGGRAAEQVAPRPIAVEPLPAAAVPTADGHYDPLSQLR